MKVSSLSRNCSVTIKSAVSNFERNLSLRINAGFYHFGSVLENDFWTPSPPLLILYMTTYFQQNYYFFYCFKVGLGQDNFWSERCGLDRLGGRVLLLGQSRGPSAAARGPGALAHV